MAPTPDTVSSHDARDPLVLALDLGSSSARAMLFDSLARSVEGVSGRVERRFESASDGTAEDHPARAGSELAQAMDQALNAAGPLSSRVAAVGMDSYAGSILGVDRGGQAVTPVYTYADTRPSMDARRLKELLGPQRDAALYARVGAPRHPAYASARRVWLRRVAPGLFARVHAWRDISTHIFADWFGHSDPPCSYSIASWNGLLDTANLQWDPEGGGDAVESLPAWRLPPLADYDQPLSGLVSPYASRWPALARVPFFLSVGDGAAANVGCGGTGPHTAVLSVGTTGAIRIAAPGTPPAVPQGLWRYRVTRDLSLLGGATSEGGSVFSWMRETLRLDEAGLDDRLAAIQPDSHGLTLLPFFSGERSPGWASEARAAIAGLSLATKPDHIARAALEAVSLRFAMIAGLMGTALDRAEHIVATGGSMLSSPVWRQIMADALGRPVIACLAGESTCRGVAVLALKALGAIPDLDALPPPLGPVLSPDPGRHEIYRTALRRQQALYRALL